MKRIIDSINLCIVTNRGCNLRCDHCYIEPELLKSTFGMSVEHFKLTYTRLGELYSAAVHANHLNVEILGGEITRMPYAFWEECLPYSIKSHQDFEVLTGKPASMAWCTNMIFQDDRYFDLLNQYKSESGWAVFIPWEMDSNRFGRNNKLYPRYLRNVKRLEGAKSMNIIPTKSLVSMPVSELRTLIGDGGFNDISCDMLYPYGSGKAFFDEHQPTFQQVSDFYLNSYKATIDLPIAISPSDEIIGSLCSGKAFNLNGNDLFDVTVEPDGNVVLNSSMTGTEAPLPSQQLHVSDPLWAIKLLFENAKQMHVKFDLEQPECDQCPYLRYCNGGYYHYKYLPAETLALYNQTECPGYRKVWEFFDDKTKHGRTSIAERNHYAERNRLRLIRKRESVIEHSVNESELGIDYQSYFEALSLLSGTRTHVIIDQYRINGLKLIERLWFYDAIGIKVSIGARVASGLTLKEHHLISRNIAFGNYLSADIGAAFVWSFASLYPEFSFSRRLNDAHAALSLTNNNIVSTSSSPSTLPSGLVVDDRNDEFFRFVLTNPPPLALDNQQVHSQPLTSTSAGYLNRLLEYVSTERLLASLGAKHQ